MNIHSRRHFCHTSFSKFLYGSAGLQFFTSLPGKIWASGSESPLRILSERPLNAETPMHLLDDEVTPEERLFVRNNGIVPEIAYGKGLEEWKLTIDGEVEKPQNFTLKELKEKFKFYTYQLILECGGNGRAGFYPQTPGTQWTYGGVGCPLWGGVRLKDVLAHVGVKSSAVYVGYYSHDTHPSGDKEKAPISRGVPIVKALDEMTMIVWEMNGKPLSPLHGFPVRLLCPGFPASASGKWLKRLWVRDKVHDGTKMTGSSYRVPAFPVAPGSSVDAKDMVIIEKMPVKSIITFPKSKEIHSEKKTFQVRGFAWTGEEQIREVHISYDFGQTWIRADLKSPRNRFAWQRWQAEFQFPKKGYYEIWARATDNTGKMQPMVVANWNPGGYLNNAMPRISVNVV